MLMMKAGQNKERDPAVNKGQSQFSYSRLNTFQHCPLQYRFHYIDKLPPRIADPLLLGGACHDFFEAYVRHLMKTSQGTDVTAGEKIMQHVFFHFERQMPPRLWTDYEATCRQFMESMVLNLGTIIGVEQELAVDRDFVPCGWMDSQVYFRAKLDRMDMEGERAIITDYKTGWGGDADPFQLELYAMMVSIFYPQAELFEIRLHYVKSGHEDIKFIEKESLARTRALLQGYTAQIEREARWKAAPGMACTTCAYTNMCSAKPSDLAAAENPGEAALLAEDVLLLEAKLRTKKEVLETFCKVNGPITSGKIWFGHGTREQYKVLDVVRFIQAIRDAGYDPLNFYKIDTSNLKKACQKDPALADALANSVAAESSTIFTHRHNKEALKK